MLQQSQIDTLRPRQRLGAGVPDDVAGEAQIEQRRGDVGRLSTRRMPDGVPQIEQYTIYIENLSLTSEELFEKLLESWQGDFGFQLIRWVTMIITLSRDGLQESMLIDLLANVEILYNIKFKFSVKRAFFAANAFLNFRLFMNNFLLMNEIVTCFIGRVTFFPMEFFQM